MNREIVKKWAGICVAVLATSAAFAQSTWTGVAGNGNWSDAGNWSGGVPGLTSTATFNSAGTTIDVSGAAIRGMYFTGGAGSFTFNSSSSPFTVGNGLVFNIAAAVTSATMTYSGPLTFELGSSSLRFQNFATATDATFNITGNITGNTSATGGLIQLEGNGDNRGTISGNITQGTGSLLSINKTNAGTWTISGNITTTGSITVSQGRLNLSGNNSGLSGSVVLGNAATIGVGSATALGTGTLTLGRGYLENLTGGTFTSSNNMIWNSNNTLNVNTQDGIGNINLTGTMAMAQAASFLIAQSSTVTLGAVTGKFRVNKSGNATSGQGTLIINHSQNDGSYSVSSGALVVNDQLIALDGIGGTTLLLASAPSNGGTFTLNGLTFDLSGATLTDGQTWSIYGSNMTAAYLGAGFAVNGFTNSGGIWTLVNGTDTWTFNQSTGQLSLSISQIPEPSTWALMGVGVGLLFWVGCWKRRASI
ncbi:MAG: PEP-CTERM sorting domain-containing protein [Verrucomicrobiales bacterium]|jgi:autotransporter-associated beta strand protein|nr:PEP-CTERM sorting domain-containing protein [Verrucomicrobiales bacterium]